MIYNQLVGGLGNMFFQLAALWSLAKDNEDDLCLLNIDTVIRDMIIYPTNPIKHAPKFSYLFNRFPQKNGNIDKIINWPFRYSKIKYEKDAQYTGYFQCEKYFIHRRKEIIELLKPANEFNLEINKYEDLFGNISLHIRRGNYIHWPHLSEIFNIVHMDYYEKAISLLPKDLKILIFSNDLPWCKINFVGDRFIFIDEIDYISIYLMAKMRHHIIPNSSFSWWGAWLSEYDDKIIIAPSKWFKSTFDGTDIVPDNWIKI